MTGADEWVQERVNPGGVGLPVTAESLAELLLRVSMYGIAVRDDEEPVMGGMWGHVSTLVTMLGDAVGLHPDEVFEVYRSEAARLDLSLD